MRLTPELPGKKIYLFLQFETLSYAPNGANLVIASLDLDGLMYHFLDHKEVSFVLFTYSQNAHQTQNESPIDYRALGWRVYNPSPMDFFFLFRPATGKTLVEKITFNPTFDSIQFSSLNFRLADNSR